MSAVKTLFVAAFLVAGLYGVFWLLNCNPGILSAPEAAKDWPRTNQWPSSVDVNPGTPAVDGSASSAPRWNSDASPTAAPPLASAVPDTGRTDAAASAVPMGSPPSTPDQPSFPVPVNSGESASDSASPLLPPAGTGGEPPSAPPWPAEGPTAVGPTAASESDRSATPIEPVVVGPPAEDPGNSGAAGALQAAAYQPEASAAAGNREDHATFIERVNEALAANRLADAHLMLSQRYADPSVPPDEARQLQGLLDQLAGTVIFSPQSYLEAPYEVLATDTLESIAARYDVPTGLLVKINGLDPTVPLKPGQQIKVVRGPFKAVIDLTRYELTLLLGGERYAGRFQIGAGPELRQEGTYMVTDKRDLSVLSAGNPTPPDGSRGTRWIGLGQYMGMHGTNQPGPLGRPTEQGCISLGQRDIEDLYDILSIGSTVIIRR